MIKLYKLNKSRILIILLLFTINSVAQTNVTIDANTSYQEIHGFGASDAWNANYVGKYWSDNIKNDIAKKLFSKKINETGTPDGIGLSRWRFNIGAGSEEQGSASNIELEERRAECFLNSNGTYNWEKQKGQQWFLNKANEYNVENLIGFACSPPRFYTKNGRANSDNSNRYGSTNLKDSYYDDYASFLTTVLNHFESEGIHFSQVSPVNEPQYEWNEGQEGCPWMNEEITQLAKELDQSLTDNGLTTKMLLAEAGSFKELYENNGNWAKANQIWRFFSSTQSSTYIGNLSNMQYGLCGHSYWTDGDDYTIRNVRENTYNKSVQYGGIELYQTEYCMYTSFHTSYIKNAIFMAKMIYADLEIANVSSWDFWTALERERWSQLNRFYLIRLRPSGGDYGSLLTGGTIAVNKNLWALGNYSLFIRPGYKRIKTTGANNLGGLMCSSYIAPDNSRIVSVYVNWGSSNVSVNHNLTNLPAGKVLGTTTPYVTNTSNNLSKKSSINLDNAYSIPAQTVVTLVTDLANNTAAIDLNHAGNVKIYPNPISDAFNVEVGKFSHNNNLQLRIYSLSGLLIETHNLQEGVSTINIGHLKSGIYRGCVFNSQGIVFEEALKVL